MSDEYYQKLKAEIQTEKIKNKKQRKRRFIILKMGHLEDRHTAGGA